MKPALKVLKEVSAIEDADTNEAKHFVGQTKKLYDFVSRADNMIDKVTEHKDNWLTKLIVKMMS